MVKLPKNRRGRRTLNLDDIPGAIDKVISGTDISSELVELIGSAFDFKYSRINLSGIPQRDARVTVNVSGGQIVSVTVHDGGWYCRTPTVSLSGGGGSGGALVPVMAGNSITGFTITPGSGYATSPTATISLVNQIRFSTKLSIPRALEITRDSSSILYYTGSANEPHIEIGNPEQLNYRVNIDLHVERASFSAWNDSTQNNDCGILLHNAYYGRVRLASDGFTIPVEIRSTNEPCAYFDCYLGLLRGGRNFLLLHKANNSNAWFNQVAYHCAQGSFNSDSGSKTRCGHTAGTRYPIAVRFWSENETHPFNNQTFYDACFEIAPDVADPWPESVPVQFEGDCMDIKFIGGTRHENKNVEFFRHKSGNVRNIQLDLSNYYSSLWDLADMWNSEAGQNRFDQVVINDNRRHGTQPKPKWVSPNLGHTSVQYDAAGHLYTPGFFWQNPSDNTKLKRSVGTTNTIAADSVEIINTDSIALHILNNNCRMLAIKPIVVSGAANLRQHWVGYNRGRTIRYSPAYATTSQSGGVIQTPSVLQGGYFSAVPTVTVTGSGGGSGAILTPVLSGGTSGTITSITVTNGGSLYSGTITIIITPNEKDWIQGNVFQRAGANFYGSYLDNAGGDAGYTLWLRPEVKELTWYGRASGGSVFLAGVVIDSLDGNPFTVVSWHNGMYSDFHRKIVNWTPSGTIDGNHQVGELLYFDNPTVSGDAWGYRVRSGPAYDACVP